MYIIEILIGYGLGCLMGGVSLYAFQQEKIKNLTEKYETTHMSLTCTFEELKETESNLYIQQTQIETLRHNFQNRIQEIMDLKEQEIQLILNTKEQEIESLEQEIKTLKKLCDDFTSCIRENINTNKKLIELLEENSVLLEVKTNEN